MAAKEKPKTKASIEECSECKSLREIVSDSLKEAEKRLEAGDISGTISAIEFARKWALLFLTEDHGPDCGYKSLKDSGTKPEKGGEAEEE